jgi:hypothetical protein
MCLRVSVKVPVGVTGMGPFAVVEEAAGHRAAGRRKGPVLQKA